MNEFFDELLDLGNLKCSNTLHKLIKLKKVLHRRAVADLGKSGGLASVGGRIRNALILTQTKIINS